MGHDRAVGSHRVPRQERHHHHRHHRELQDGQDLVPGEAEGQAVQRIAQGEEHGRDHGQRRGQRHLVPGHQRAQQGGEERRHLGGGALGRVHHEGGDAKGDDAEQDHREQVGQAVLTSPSAPRYPQRATRGKVRMPAKTTGWPRCARSRSRPMSRPIRRAVSAPPSGGGISGIRTRD